MNWRATGCGVLAAAVFLAVAIVAVWRTWAPAGCPDTLNYEPAPFVRDGAASDEPRLPGVDEELRAAGQASFGLAAWPVWVVAADAPTASAAPLPERIVLDCGDGTFQAYRRDGG